MNMNTNTFATQVSSSYTSWKPKVYFSGSASHLTCRKLGTLARVHIYQNLCTLGIVSSPTTTSNIASHIPGSQSPEWPTNTTLVFIS